MKKRWIARMLLVALLVAQLSVISLADESGRVAAESRSGVVRIIAEFDEYYALGSGFGVGEVGEETRYFVTNHHVVFESGNYGSIPAINVWIMLDDKAWDPATGLDTSRCIPCEVVYAEEDGYPDLAILKASRKVPDRVALPLMGDDSLLEAGDSVYALGYPSSSDLTEQTIYGEKLVADIEDVTITRGIVSRFTNSSTFGNTDIIQHDANINHGNSGGPLINENGLVVGVNTYGFGQDVSSGDSQSFASIHISEVIDILDDLDIEYQTEEDIAESGSNILVLVASVAVGVVLIVVVVVIVILRKKKNRAQTAPVIEPQYEPAADEESIEAVPVMAPEVDGRPRLQCLSGTFAQQRFTIDSSIRIGRDPARNDLVFPADAQGISGVHCEVTADNDTVWLKDLGSTYGTFLATGQRLAASEAVQLRVGDKFWLGSEKEMFVIAPKGGI